MATLLQLQKGGKFSLSGSSKCKNQHMTHGCSFAKAPSKAISKSDSQEPDGAFDFWEFNATCREVLSHKKIGSIWLHVYLEILGHTWSKKVLHATSVLVLVHSYCYHTYNII